MRNSKSHRGSGYASGVLAQRVGPLIDLSDDLIDLASISYTTSSVRTSITDSAHRLCLKSSEDSLVPETASCLSVDIFSMDNPWALMDGNSHPHSSGDPVDQQLLQKLQSKRVNYDEDLYYSMETSRGFDGLIGITFRAEYVTVFTREIMSCAMLNPQEPLERSDKVPRLYPWELVDQIRHFHKMQRELVRRLHDYIRTLVDDPQGIPKLDLIRHQLGVINYLLADISEKLKQIDKPGKIVEDIGLIIRDSLAVLLDLTRQFAKWWKSPNPSKRSGHLRHCDQENDSVTMHQYMMKRGKKLLQWNADNVFGHFAITHLPKTICPHSLWCIRTRAISFVLERLKFNKEALCVRWALHLSEKRRIPVTPNGEPYMKITGYRFVHEDMGTRVKGVQVEFDPALFKTRDSILRWFQGAQRLHLTTMEERLHCSLQERVEEFSGSADRCRSHDWEELYRACTCHIVPGVDDDETVLRRSVAAL